ncbi:ATPase synthesis protein 25, mitochondrial [Diutina catenulata]
MMLASRLRVVATAASRMARASTPARCLSLTCPNPQEASTPWYLRDEATSQPEQPQIELPTIPPTAPAVVGEFCELLARDYGMAELVLFDLSELEPEHPSSPHNQAETQYVVICEGKSEKHVYKAAQEMRTYIKHTHHELPRIEGVVASALSPKQRRRMLRRARKGPMATDNDYGMSANSWVVARIQGLEIHMLTGPRRRELVLEEMFCRDEDKSRWAGAESVAESDDIFSGIRRYHTRAAGARGVGSLGSIRSYSTIARNQPLTLARNRVLTIVRNQCLTACSQYSTIARNHGPEIAAGFDHDWDAAIERATAALARNPCQQTLATLTAAVYGKHSRLGVHQDPSHDLTGLMTAAIDASARTSDKSFADALLAQTAEAVTHLFRFQQPNLVVDSPEMMWLLVRMCYQARAHDPVMSRAVSQVISGEAPLDQRRFRGTTNVAVNRLRDVGDLVESHLRDAGRVLSPELKELFLFTYGNGGEWTRFWQVWDTQFAFLGADRARQYVRLVVYLALRGHQQAQVELMYRYWDAGAEAMRPVLEAADLTAGEKAALVAATASIVKNTGGFEHVMAAVEAL